MPERAAAWLEDSRRANPAGFGNARTVRKLLETMEGRMADRFVRGGGGFAKPDEPALPGAGTGSMGPGAAAPSEFLPADVPDPPVRAHPGRR